MPWVPHASTTYDRSEPRSSPIPDESTMLRKQQLRAPLLSTLRISRGGGLAARPPRRRILVGRAGGIRSRPRGAALTSRVFDLPDPLAAKADPALIAGDEAHFAAIAEALRLSIAEVSDRLAVELRSPGGSGQAALDRDLAIHRLSGRLRTLRRFGLD
ncbi:MAG: hypothetical protein ACRDT9_11235, partial [Agromyces sp.]